MTDQTTIPDLLKNPSPVQARFREEMIAAGFEVRTHPLHGMRDVYGVEARITHASTPYRPGQNTPHAQDVYRATRIRLETDQIGYNVVLYPVDP